MNNTEFGTLPDKTVLSILKYKLINVTLIQLSSEAKRSHKWIKREQILPSQERFLLLPGKGIHSGRSPFLYRIFLKIHKLAV